MDIHNAGVSLGKLRWANKSNKEKKEHAEMMAKEKWTNNGEYEKIRETMRILGQRSVVSRKKTGTLNEEMKRISRLPRKQIPFETRIEVLKRGKNKCVYCFTELNIDTMTVEHKIPKYLGGSDNIENLDLSCFGCNGARGGRDQEEHKEYIRLKKSNISTRELKQRLKLWREVRRKNDEIQIEYK